MDPRPSDEPPMRYSDRFRTSESAASDFVVLGESDEPPRSRTWPPWLIRTAGVLGVAAAAAVALTLGDRDAPAPDAGPTTAATVNPAPNPAPNPSPPSAQIAVLSVSARPWPTRGFTYRLTLANTSDEAYQVIGVGPGMSGTELEWNRDLIVPPGSAADLRIDYLVVNCRAATTGSVPSVIRLVVRHGGDSGRVELAHIPVTDQANAIHQLGDQICGDDPTLVQPLG